MHVHAPFLRPNPNMPSLAYRLIVNQFLHSFRKPSKLTLAFAKLWGNFVKKLVRQCINLTSKRGRAYSPLLHLVDDLISDPRALDCCFAFERINRGDLLHREADIVEAIHQTMLFERIDVE